MIDTSHFAYDIKADDIKNVRKKYGLSLAQFGELVNAPATSVKRWQEGVRPQDNSAVQIVLVLQLLRDPDDVYYELGRHQGVRPNRDHWEGFVALINGVKDSLRVAHEAELPSPEVGSAVVSGVKGLLALIANALASKKDFGKRAYPVWATKIASFLK